MLFYLFLLLLLLIFFCSKATCTTNWGRRGRDRMVVGFAITYAISACRL